MLFSPGTHVGEEALIPAVMRDGVIDAYDSHVSQSWAALARLMDAHVEVRAEGSRVWDEEGTEYLDCGGYGVFLLGHRHPRLVEAVKAQLDRQGFATRVLLNGGLAQAATSLADKAPPGLEYVFMTNSGAEATELGLKLAKASGAKRVVAMENGFHGKTNGALSVTGRALYREPFQPLLPNISFIRFGDVAELEQALSGDERSALILEPIQAEGGVVIPPPGYLREVERLCRERGTFLILDEIQTGLGRLGVWWGADIEGVRPDVMLVGKILSGGLVPVGAVVATAEAFEPLNMDPLIHTSTYSGNPVAMAAVQATLETLEQEDAVGRSARLGARIKELIADALDDACPDLVAEVRGLGCLIAVEFREDHLAGDFVFELLHRHVIVSTSLNTNRVVRLHPSVVMGDDDLAWLRDAVHESGAAVADRFGSGVSAGA
jgi:putrescine aminotransferase